MAEESDHNVEPDVGTGDGGDDRPDPAHDIADQDGQHTDAEDQPGGLDDEPDDAFDDDPLAAAVAKSRLTLSAINAARLGTLVLHFAARDVTVLIDGDAAMRLLEIYRQRGQSSAVEQYAEGLDPANSSASVGWVVTDPASDDLLAVSWIPGLPSKPPRVAVDPDVGV